MSSANDVELAKSVDNNNSLKLPGGWVGYMKIEYTHQCASFFVIMRSNKCERKKKGGIEFQTFF